MASSFQDERGEAGVASPDAREPLSWSAADLCVRAGPEDVSRAPFPDHPGRSSKASALCCLLEAPEEGRLDQAETPIG